MMRVPFDHSGASFDSFVEEEGLLEEVEASAIKRVIAWQLAETMREQGVSRKRWPSEWARAGHSAASARCSQAGRA
jgi:hypothetical protein